ncbi:MAG: OmpW/AlkL family protein [Pseudomonadota bacterium]
MKKRVLVALLAAAGFLSATAYAESPWMLRGRIANIDPDTSGAVAPGLEVDVDNNWGVVGDVVYFFTPNISATLLFTYPQKHDVSVSTIGAIGDIKHLPPTLTLDYHFNVAGNARVYVGAGVTWLYITSDDLRLPNGTPVDIDKSNFGPAVRVGLDYPLTKNWYLNVDVQKSWVSTDVTVPALGIGGDIDIDPWVYGVGVGYRF